MKRRTLDLLFSIGGVGLAALLLIIGVVMSSNAVGVLLLVALSIAGFVHALVTPKNRAFAATEPDGVTISREMVTV